MIAAAVTVVGCGSGGDKLNRSSFSGAWPWAASTVTVGCDRVFDGPLLWVEISGTRYAMNGLAVTRRPDWRPLNESTPTSVWLSSPSGARVPITDMLAAATARC